MKLQILVTQYMETDDLIKRLLDSIAIQQGVDFNEVGVIICNDGTDVHLAEETLQGYPFRIEYYLEPHRGVSGTRNALFEHSTADYVMFCDGDDMFLNVCGLYLIFLNIDVGFDTFNPTFIEEARYKDTGQVVYVTHENDATFIHGKVHRRQYLVDKNIRWNEKLTVHEDSYFNVLCQNLTTNVRKSDVPFYLWKWRDESVCRRDKKFMLKTYDKLLDSNEALVDEFIKRGIMNKAMYFITFMTFETYYTMNKPEWVEQENQEYRKKTEERFAAYFKKYKKLWEEVPIFDKMKVSEQARQKAIKDGMLVEAVSIFDWLERIGG